jgi:DNA-binding response OmpR family regulator
MVLLDVDLPRLDGLAVLRRLAHDGLLQHTRVIMLTFRADEREVLEALELGAFDHVTKPFSLPVLMQRIRRTLQV